MNKGPCPQSSHHFSKRWATGTAWEQASHAPAFLKLMWPRRQVHQTLPNKCVMKFGAGRRVQGAPGAGTNAAWHGLGVRGAREGGSEQWFPRGREESCSPEEGHVPGPWPSLGGGRHCSAQGEGCRYKEGHPHHRSEALR